GPRLPGRARQGARRRRRARARRPAPGPSLPLRGRAMRLFGRDPDPAFDGTPEDLAALGRQAFGGNDPHPPGFSALAPGQLDGYAMTALSSAGHPTPGTPGWRTLQGRFLDELTAAAERGGDWAYVGALCV